jgi:hypothetical protein
MDWFNEIWNSLVLHYSGYAPMWAAPGKTAFPILLFGYLHFFLVSYWVHDMKTVRAKIITVGSIFAVDAVALVVFGAVLGWL